MHLLVKHFQNANTTGISAKVLSVTKNTSRHHVPNKAQQTKGELKAVGQIIFSTYEKTCKENLGKPFSEVLLAVAELNLQGKQSTYEKKKQRLKSQRQFKASVEAAWSQTDVNAHLAQRTSLATRAKQRAHQSFETVQEGKNYVLRKPHLT